MIFGSTWPALGQSAIESGVVSNVVAASTPVFDPPLDGAVMDSQSPSQFGSVESDTRYTLDNGIHVHLLPRVDCGWAGVIASYGVGFIDDPKGYPQLAHLVEHLRVTGATDDQGASERWSYLNSIGSANAETQPHFTYYDYLVPSDSLELVLKTEAQRLGELRLTQADIEREGPRAAAEATGLAATNPKYLHKFALMAGVQAWRWGELHSNIATGIEDTPLEVATNFIQRHYRSDKLTIYIAGDFEIDKVRRMLDSTLGLVEQPDEPSTRRDEDWSSVSKDFNITWDLPATIAVAAAIPPAKAQNRAVITTSMTVRQFMDQQRSMGVVMPLGTSQQWPAGVLPLFLMGMIEPSIDPGDATAALSERLVFRAEAVTTTHLTMAHQVTTMRTQKLTPEMIKVQAKNLASRNGIDESRAMGMIVLQGALNEAMMAKTETVPDSVRDEEWRKILVHYGQALETGTVVILPTED